MFKRKCTALPSRTDSQDMAEKFSTYFSDKVERIRSDILEKQKDASDKQCQQVEQQSAQPPQMATLPPVTEQEMNKIIRKSNAKCCSLDPIPTTLLKKCLDSLLPTICRIMNLSLQTSKFPKIFKNAIVTPLLKKPSLDKENLKNYRPVSNLSYNI